ncbi:2-dehydropantoate 2-reductase [Simiduia curdlanivorans]|uniref:2-dehydropantoate 2-reductase n=1 Tax=Simiduia curdlanivorans TaxID=1492769 RepID=A0ABV8UYB0_9GAMM|nr:2-dehydropantoate 2-reductase [Simiduia curdlanivorans]MDN3640297.1 2-dehydropantoate 2-reductase [Simiduia curdlanivorans]
MVNPNIVIFGAGSIGCYVGGCLLAAGGDVSFIGRSRIQQQIQQHGFHLTDWRGRKSLISADKIRFSLSNEAIAKADYILVTVKSANTAEAAAQIAQYAKPSAVIVSFQNGIHNADTLQQGLAEHRVLKGMVPFNVISAGGGHFHCGTEGNLALEIDDGSAQALLNALQLAQLPVQTYRDLTGIQWSKLLLNLNNAVNALSGMPLRDQLYDPQYRRLMALIVQEALEVVKAAGIKPLRTGKVVPGLLPTVLRLPTWLFKRVASALLKIDPAARSSMYEDLQLGRKTEVDYINGEIVQLAKQCRIEAPMNNAIVRLIKDTEAKQSGSPKLNADALFAKLKATKIER